MIKFRLNDRIVNCTDSSEINTSKMTAMLRNIIIATFRDSIYVIKDNMLGYGKKTALRDALQF